ncbi:MAG: hypothetical protein ACM3SY_02875 [Candidatus Omnitrophota bacterium]
MVIDDYLIHYKKPSQYIYWGENGVDVFNRDESEKAFRKTQHYPNVSLLDITPEQFKTIARDMLAFDTGIFFNSGQFIFNIFEFEKIPVREKTRREIVEWRLKKVFPENLDDYDHQFFPVGKKRILSVLFKKSLKEKVETFFEDNKLSLIYMGNSTLEIFNHASAFGRTAPDFFVEIDRALSIIVFLDKGVPIYVRKFRSDQTAPGIVNEIVKTVNFMKNNYQQDPHTFFLVGEPTEIDFNFIQEELTKLEIRPLELKNRAQLFFTR